MPYGGNILSRTFDCSEQFLKIVETDTLDLNTHTHSHTHKLSCVGWITLLRNVYFGFFLLQQGFGGPM